MFMVGYIICAETCDFLCHLVIMYRLYVWLWYFKDRNNMAGVLQTPLRNTLTQSKCFGFFNQISFHVVPGAQINNMSALVQINKIGAVKLQGWIEETTGRQDFYKRH